jgi:DHA3 family macrolide efflux protein-like MFS transporter
MQGELDKPNSTTARYTASHGIWGFGLIWFGQLVSLIGSSLTSFALSVWAYQTTDSATPATLVILATMGPSALLSLVAGPFVDRWDRRWVMILSDTGSSLSTFIVLLALTCGQGALWLILLATAANSAFSAFQWLAYTASTTLLVPKEHLGRANGMVQIGQAIVYIASPALAGFLVTRIQVQGVILIDFATFVFSVFSLLLVHIPRPKDTDQAGTNEGTWLREFLYGLTYLVARPGLMGLLVLFALLNFLLGLVSALLTPMALSFTDADTLGTMISISLGGMLLGGILMSIWGGPKRRIHGVLGGLLLAGLALSVVGLRPSVALPTAAGFAFFFSFVIVSACNDALWQGKVAAGVQGRIFGTRNTIATLTVIPAYALSGPVADKVFEPLLVTEGPLSGSVGQIVGVGHGRGIGLMFIAAGALTVLATATSYLFPRIRLVEDESPDAIIDESSATLEKEDFDGQPSPDSSGDGESAQ